MTEPLRKRFGRRVRQLRRYQELTQDQLAQQIGVTTETISNIERGKNAPSFETIEKLAEVFGVAEHELFTFDTLPSSPSARRS